MSAPFRRFQGAPALRVCDTRRVGWNPATLRVPGPGPGRQPGSECARTPPAAPSRPYLGGARLLDRKRDNLDGSIERLLLVGLPPERQELQVFPRRWGSGLFHGRAEER